MIRGLPTALAAAWVAFPALAGAQTTSLVTVGPDGQADSGSLYAEMSSDARWITYQSGASNLVAGDTNGAPDIFLFDRMDGSTRRVSVASNGAQANGDCLDPHISLDGRHITWFSYATNHVAGDTNGKTDVFVHDSVTAVTVRVSVGTGGVQADKQSRYPMLSGDGRLCAFESDATNLVVGDANGARDVFVHDLQTGVTTRVSTAADGTQGDADSLDASISPDGRYCAFESTASNLVPNDANGVSDVFVKDLQTGAIVRVSVGAGGVEGDGPSSNPSLSELALRCSFESDAANLVPMDANAWHDVFVRDLAAGTTVLASLSSEGGQSHLGAYEGTLSTGGNFVAFYSQSSNLVPDDSNSEVDIFVRDLSAGTTERVSVGSVGQEGMGHCLYPALTPDGRYIAFDSTAENLVIGDSNGSRDIFLRDLESPFRPFCAGDSSIATDCPCGNAGEHGRGCENSGGTGGAVLVASGATSPDSVRLDLAGVPADVLCMVVQSSASQTGGVVFDDGIRCLAGAERRLYAQRASSGLASFPGIFERRITERSAQLGDPILPGATRFYQVFFREPDAGFCPPGNFNSTNALRIGW